MLAPKSHGGLELELWAVLKIMAALAKIDGSFGWAAMIGSGGNVTFTRPGGRPLTL
jgi:hypothetical protein